MNKEDMMRLLVDKYGFSYAVAANIVQHQDARSIFQYIQISYMKGKTDGMPNYNYSGGQ